MNGKRPNWLAITTASIIVLMSITIATLSYCLATEIHLNQTNHAFVDDLLKSLNGGE